MGLLVLSRQGQAAVSSYLRWLGVPAGLLVAGLGVWLLTRYLRAGAHPHSHAGGHRQPARPCDDRPDIRGVRAELG